MSYHDNNYLLQDALEAYLSANLATYAGGVAAGLPIVKGGDFGNRGRSHIYIVAPELAEGDGIDWGSFSGNVIVGVGTLKDVTEATHRSYCKAVFDLIMDLDVVTYINDLATNALRINHRMPGARTRIGAISESVRFSEIEVGFRVYQTT